MSADAAVWSVYPADRMARALMVWRRATAALACPACEQTGTVLIGFAVNRPVRCACRECGWSGPPECVRAAVAVAPVVAG